MHCGNGLPVARSPGRILLAKGAGQDGCAKAMVTGGTPGKPPKDKDPGPRHEDRAGPG